MKIYSILCLLFFNNSFAIPVGGGGWTSLSANQENQNSFFSNKNHSTNLIVVKLSHTGAYFLNHTHEKLVSDSDMKQPHLGALSAFVEKKQGENPYGLSTRVLSVNDDKVRFLAGKNDKSDDSFTLSTKLLSAPFTIEEEEALTWYVDSSTFGVYQVDGESDSSLSEPLFKGVSGDQPSETLFYSK